MFAIQTLGRVAALAAAVTLIAAAPVSAAPDPTPAPAKPAKDTQYCVMQTVTGSHVERRTCKTRAEWIDEDGFDPAKK